MFLMNQHGLNNLYWRGQLGIFLPSDLKIQLLFFTKSTLAVWFFHTLTQLEQFLQSLNSFYRGSHKDFFCKVSEIKQLDFDNIFKVFYTDKLGKIPLLMTICFLGNHMIFTNFVEQSETIISKSGMGILKRSFSFSRFSIKLPWQPEFCFKSIFIQYNSRITTVNFV